MLNAVRAALLLGALMVAGAGAPVSAQTVEPDVGRTPGSRMHTLLQRTLLKVDVLTVDLCFDESTGRRLAQLAGRGRLSGAAGDSIVRAVLAGGLAVGRVEFLRDIPLADFLDGVGEDLRHAVATGMLADSIYRALAAGLPAWYAPLERRGIRKGDRLVYEMRRDAVRTVFSSRDGHALLDRTDAGRERRNSPLAAWLAPGSQFRAGLLQSLQRPMPPAPRSDDCRGRAR